MSITIIEIAKMAGVSRTTVSRYLNNGYVSSEKAERIRAAIEKTGYQPSRQAQMLRTKQTKLIGVIIPKIDSNSIGREVAGIGRILNRAGYELLLANTNNNEADELKYLRMFDSNRSVDGVILIGTILTQEHLRLLSGYALPVVVIGQSTDVCSCVYHDDYHAAKSITERLLKTGHSIGYIGVTEKDKAAGAARKQGFTDALTQAGIPVKPEYMIQSTFRMESGYEAAKLLFGKKPYPDSVFCATDNIAIGALLYLREQGIRVPEDVQISGIGDSQKAHIVQPPLTTVHYYYGTSGREAASLLLELLSGEDDVKKSVKMGYRLVEGGSARPLLEE